LTMRRGTKLEKQVLAAITTLRHKAVAQWHVSTVMTFPFEEMVDVHWKCFWRLVLDDLGEFWL
jgi:hypothetical protein